MDRRAPRNRIAIFGAGKVGTAMSLEMPTVPLVRRGEDCFCDIACICWPAHALRDFAASHPLACTAETTRVAFSNGAWAREDTNDLMDHQGICYVRVNEVGEGAREGYRGWRVGIARVSKELHQAGLGVVCSRSDHNAHLWGKCLYILPLAMACDATGLDAKRAGNTPEWSEWYDVVKQKAIKAIGEKATITQEKRALYLITRSPKGWKPSPSAEELEYFKEKLCAS